MISNEELDKAMLWVVRGLKEAAIDPQNVQAVVTWMIENQLPAKDVWLAETEAKDEEERLATIEALKAEITKLEGGIVNV